MADPIEVCEAVIERLSVVLPDWELFISEPQPPAQLPLPAGIVEMAPTRAADYVQVDGDWTKWFVHVVLYASAVQWESSLRKMAPLLGTKGPIYRALKDDMGDYDDALAALSNGFVQPTTLSGFKLTQKNKSPVRTATIAVTVGTN